MPCLASSTAGGAKPLVIAIKRVVLDARIARAAAVEAGAELVEDDAGRARGLLPGGRALDDPLPDRSRARRYTARALVIADGALSRLARALGLVTTPPDAVCSRSYIAPGTSDFAADGVLFYPASLLPGYCSVFREADGSFSFCCYVIPGGSTRLTDLKARHHELLGSDPHLRDRPWGRRPGWSRCARRRSGSAACRGARATTSCVVGDAAGQIDPADGRGHSVRHGRRGARGRRRSRRRSRPATSASRSSGGTTGAGWPPSAGISAGPAPWRRAYVRYPVLLDASAEMMRRRGSAYFMEWAEAMTGLKPKRTLIGPARRRLGAARGGRPPEGKARPTARRPRAVPVPRAGLDARRVLSGSVRVT